MGTPSSDPCRASTESLHEVFLTRRFEMMTSEVERSELLQAIGHRSPPGCEAEGCPASDVTWHAAAAYCNVLSSRAGLPACYACKGPVCERRPELAGSAFYGCQGYRLPTEAEWEWSYRAGSATALYNGPLDVCTGASAAADPIAWYAANASDRLHPRATRLPNAWGLYDLAGNVLEWTHDGHAEPLDAVDPVGPDLGEGTTRVMRGGSFRDPPGALRAAASRLGPPALHTDEMGFRCVRTLPVAQQNLVSGIAPPRKHDEYAADLDGPPKNTRGNLVALAQQVGIDLLVDEQIAKGKILLLTELGGTSIKEQPRATLQTFGGQDTDQEPTNNFTGSAAIAIASKRQSGGLLEGPLHEGRLVATGRLLLPLPIWSPLAAVPLVVLPIAVADLTYSPTGASGTIGGAMTQDDLDHQLLPLVAAALNWILDPKNTGVDPATKQTIRDTLDANHDGSISVNEIRDSIIGRALVPDIDLDGDGQPEAYSIGVGVTFTTCTIVR